MKWCLCTHPPVALSEDMVLLHPPLSPNQRSVQLRDGVAPLSPPRTVNTSWPSWSTWIVGLIFGFEIQILNAYRLWDICISNPSRLSHGRSLETSCWSCGSEQMRLAANATSGQSVRPFLFTNASKIGKRHPAVLKQCKRLEFVEGDRKPNPAIDLLVRCIRGIPTHRRLSEAGSRYRADARYNNWSIMLI